METKTCTIAVSIEPSLYALAANEAEVDEQALSAWARGAIIEKLHRAGKLDADRAVAILSGASVKVVKQLIEADKLRRAAAEDRIAVS